MKRIFSQVANNLNIFDEFEVKEFDRKYNFVYKFKGRNKWHLDDEFEIKPVNNSIFETMLTKLSLTTN